METEAEPSDSKFYRSLIANYFTSGFGVDSVLAGNTG